MTHRFGSNFPHIIIGDGCFVNVKNPLNFFPLLHEIFWIKLCKLIEHSGLHMVMLTGNAAQPIPVFKLSATDVSEKFTWLYSLHILCNI